MADDFETMEGAADPAALEGLLVEWCRDYPADDRAWDDAVRARQTAARLLDPAGAMDVMIGLRSGRAVAFAACVAHQPSRSPGGDLHVKHLFVRQDARGRGTGTLMLRALAARALALGCGRLEWTAARSNLRANALYDRLGVPRAEHVLVYRLGADRLENFAAGGEHKQR